MKAHVYEIMSTYEVLVKVINEKREKAIPIPGPASARIERLFTALGPDFKIYSTKQYEVIQKYGYEEMDEAVNKDGVKEKGLQAAGGVYPEKAKDYVKEWSPTSNDEIEINCEPLPLSCFGNGPTFFYVDERLAMKPFIKDDLVFV